MVQITIVAFKNLEGVLKIFVKHKKCKIKAVNKPLNLKYDLN